MPIPPTSPAKAVDLRPGHTVRIPVLGLVPVAATPIPLPGNQVVIRLGWERLAMVVHPAAPLEAITTHTADAYRLWNCPHCAGSGLCATFPGWEKARRAA